MVFVDSMYFLKQELMQLYEHNLNIQKYFLRLKVGCNCAKGTCGYPKKYWVDVKDDIAAFLSQNNILFEWDFNHRMVLHELTILQSESGQATQKIQIMIFENKIEVRYNLDSSLKKFFSFALDDAPLAMKLVDVLYRDALNDLAGEIKAIKEKFRKISDKVCGLSEKSAQIAASSIKALCKNAKLRHFDAIVNINGMRKQIYYKDFLINPRILFEDSIEEGEKCILEA